MTTTPQTDDEKKWAEMLEARLRFLRLKFDQASAAALYMIAQNVLTNAIRRAPMDTGTLRGSGYVTLPIDEGGISGVTIGFGGAAGAYAMEQHERLDFNHEVGEAKFLEKAINEVRPKMSAQAARLIKAWGENPPQPGFGQQHPTEPQQTHGPVLSRSRRKAAAKAHKDSQPKMHGPKQPRAPKSQAQKLLGRVKRYFKKR